MGRPYSVTMDPTSLTTADTPRSLIRLSAPADAIVELLRAEIFNGDVENANQVSAILQRASTDGTGTAATPAPLEAGDPAFGGTAVVNCTVEPTLSGDPLYQTGFDLRNGMLWVPTPDERIILSPSGRIVLRLDSDAGETILIGATLTFREIGG